jgi:hypothetical protein
LPGVGQIEALSDSAGKIESLRNHHLAGRAGKVEGNMIAEHMRIPGEGEKDSGVNVKSVPG